MPRIPLFLWVISPTLSVGIGFFRPHGFRMQICAMEVIFISRNKSKILALTVSSAMVALSVVFTRFIGYSPEGTPLRFELGFLPIAVAAYAFGPIYSALGYLTADVIGSFYSGYAPNIWITLCQFLSGIIMGLMLHKKRCSPARVTATFTIIAVAIELLAKSPVFIFMYGWTVEYTLAMRALNAVINLPIRIITFYFLMRAIKKPIDRYL